VRGEDLALRRRELSRFDALLVGESPDHGIEL
jgi:hypothetical protein